MIRHPATSALGMGVVMAAMAMMAVHMVLTSEHALGLWAVAGFIALHVVAFALAGLVVMSWPAARRIIRGHKPGARHIGIMSASASVTAGLIHLIHGGP